MFQHLKKLESLEVAIANGELQIFLISSLEAIHFQEALISQPFHLNARAIRLEGLILSTVIETGSLPW